MDDSKCMFFDVEMRTEDHYPVLMGLLVDEEFDYSEECVHIASRTYTYTGVRR